MTLQPRDRRALAILGAAAVIAGILYFWPAGGTGPKVVSSVDSVNSEEKRLARLRDIAALAPQ